jgi:hypothetical protein
MDCPVLDTINKLYGHYYENPSYVYKMCLHQYIIIMKKLPDTLTNEDRKDIMDARYAKFRANKLKVCIIVDIFNLFKKIEHVINNYFGKKVKYQVNEIVKPDIYDMDSDNVCAGGIHYFNDMCRAFYYRSRRRYHTGNWIDWYDNGQIRLQSNYRDGKKIGLWIEWHGNGQMSYRGNYRDDKKTGDWIHWYDDGLIISDSTYL